MKINLKRTIENLGKNVSFMQPAYESIINSLEAKAKNIKIIFTKDCNELIKDSASIDGFSIEDDGEGFTQKNVLAFDELWTDNKSDQGCKGSGRFTWLAVYKNINIESHLKTENKIIKIPFSNKYNDETDKQIIPAQKIETNKTIIHFSNVTNRFYEAGIRDRREKADINTLYFKIKEYLLVRLYLLKKSGENFKITIVLDGQSRTLDDSKIEDLETFEFDVKSRTPSIDGQENYKFKAFYRFYSNDNTKRKNKIYLCSNNRPSEQILEKEIGLNADFPDNNTLTLLISSKYLDDKDNDSRGGLTELHGKKNETAEYPILISHILSDMQPSILNIVKKKFPNIDRNNEIETKKAIEEAPHLYKFIASNNDIIKTENKLLSDAEKRLKDAKLESQKKFSKLIKSKNIDPNDLITEIDNMNEIACIELGGYFLYRQNILNGLSIAIKDKSKYEKYIHNILMTMKTDELNNSNVYKSNFWLLDDKFMNFSYAFSDKTIKHINKTLKNYIKFKNGARRPDVAIFYNQPENSSITDAIVIELKGLNAKTDEKKKSLSEINDNVGALKKSLGEKLRNVWAYIITTIDEDFEETINNTPGYKPLFTTDSKHKIYYSYNEKLNAHIFIQDMESVIADSEIRNEVFLKILKSHNK